MHLFNNFIFYFLLEALFHEKIEIFNKLKCLVMVGEFCVHLSLEILYEFDLNCLVLNTFDAF